MIGEWGSPDPVAPKVASRLRPTITRAFRGEKATNHEPVGLWDRRAEERLHRILARLDAGRASD